MKEHIAQHTIPRRASLPVQEEPRRTHREQPASQHNAGHESGIHPIDHPYTTAPQQPRSTRQPAQERQTEDVVYQNRMPSSVRRYHQPPTRIQEEARSSWSISWQRFLLACSAVAVAAILLAVLLSSVIAPAWNRWQDGLHYGYPRIFQTDHTGTHYIAVNNHGVIELLSIPPASQLGSQKPQFYVVSRMSGTDADLVPVTNLIFTDVNNDGREDIEVVTPDNIYVLFADGKGGYSPTMPTP